MQKASDLPRTQVSAAQSLLTLSGVGNESEKRQIYFAEQLLMQRTMLFYHR